MVVKNGDTVVIKYEGKLESGEVFDSSDKHGQPLEFCCGSGRVIPGFDEAVIGMKKGQKKEFEIPPEKAYGEIREDLKREIPKNSIPNPEGQEFQAGMVLMAASPDGQQFPVKISEVKDEIIVVDLNHPLAGKKLIFNIELVDIKPVGDNQSSESEKEHSCSECESSQDCSKKEE